MEIYDIRKGRQMDIDQLLRLYRPERAVTDFSGLHTRKRFRCLIQSRNDLLIVAVHKGKILGALDAEFYNESRFSYFANLVVTRDKRKKGIGRRLIREYERICRKRGIKTIAVLVYDFNRKMHGLMKKTRYKDNGKLVEYLKRL